MRIRETYPQAVGLPKLIVKRLLDLISFRGPTHTEKLSKQSNKPMSIFIRHLDCGSCNACEREINALFNPVYDIEKLGVQLVSSPRHADALIMTGPFTRNLEEAALKTAEAMPKPIKIVTVGDCADEGGIFNGSYAITKRPEELEASIIKSVPGCPPAPSEILEALAHLT